VPRAPRHLLERVHAANRPTYPFEWGPRNGPHAPERSSRPGGAGTLLWSGRRRRGPRHGPHAPRRSRPGGAGTPLDTRAVARLHRVDDFAVTGAAAEAAAQGVEDLLARGRGILGQERTR